LKAFWNRYSYTTVKLIVNYIIFSVFGLSLLGAVSLGFAKSEADPTPLMVTGTVAAVLLYVFVSYGEIWKAGDADTLVVTGGELRYDALTGLYIGLLASVPNFLIALLMLLSSLFPKGLSWLSAGVVVVNFVYNGMWRGIMNLGRTAIGSQWWFYLAVSVPTLAVSFFGYLAGVKGLHLTRLFIPENPEEREIKREKAAAKHRTDDEEDGQN
jgi:hypothetical protein